MKILQYTLGLPPYRRGGLPRYSVDLSKELSKENKVYLLYPGQINPYSKKIKLINKKNDYLFQTIEMKNPLPVSLGLGIKDEKYYMEKRNISELKKLVKDIKPDVVHFHTLMGMPKEFLEYLHKNRIKVIYTTNDFYGLCPKMLSLNPKKELRSSKCSYDCTLCNVGPSYKKIVIMQSHLYAQFKESKLIRSIRLRNKSNLTSENNYTYFSGKEVNNKYKLRKYYIEMFNLIDIFHFNSTVSMQYFKRYFPHIKGKVISITHDNLKDCRTKVSPKVNTPIKLGYVGAYGKKKGFFLYTEILKGLRNNNQFEAHFYGDTVDRPIFKNKAFISHGVLSSNKLNEEYKNLDILIVPSHETFGYTVLEALLNGTPCLVSDKAGAKDLVPKSWIFKNKRELKNKLIELINTPSKVKSMKETVSLLNLQYKMADHVKNIVMELYKNEF